MNNPLVINIQKCSIHDGPGIRTTVFFKGCPLECMWCHNPESQEYSKEVLYNEEKCSGCKACVKVCPNQAVYNQDDKILLDKSKCTYCETCLDYCVNNAREIVGDSYTVKELMKEIKKDRMFYEESGGGVTLSGGEVMAQNIDYLEELCKSCKYQGISVIIDTCGHANYESYQRLLPYVDGFLYDIKLIDSQKHKQFTGKPNNLILNNLTKLSENNADINIRIPLICGVNVDDVNEEVNKIIDFITPLNIKKVNLLPYHNIGMHKYEKLYKQYEGLIFERPSDEKLEEIKNLFSKNNFDVKIGG